MPVRGVEVKVHTFLTSALDTGEWFISFSSYFVSKERAHGTHRV
jgi:hypothetical protein